MATNPATPSDVAARWRPLTTQEAALAVELLNDAWLDLISLMPSIPTRLDAGTLATGLVVRVQAAMVVRVFRNPDGLREYAIDDFRAVRDQALSGGLLAATPDELRLLTANKGRSRSVRLVAYDSVLRP